MDYRLNPGLRKKRRSTEKISCLFPQTLYRLGMVRMARGVPADFPQVYEGSPVHSCGVPVSEFAVCFMEFDGI